MATETLLHHTLLELADSGAVRELKAVAVGDRWALIAKYGLSEKTLVAKSTGKPRLFSRADALLKYAKDTLGIVDIRFDAHNYQPAQRSRTRPKQSAAMKKLHEAAAHDVWFRGEVASALAKIEAGEAQFIEHEQATAAHEQRMIEKYGPRPE